MPFLSICLKMFSQILLQQSSAPLHTVLAFVSLSLAVTRTWTHLARAGWVHYGTQSIHGLVYQFRRCPIYYLPTSRNHRLLFTYTFFVLPTFLPCITGFPPTTLTPYYVQIQGTAALIPLCAELPPQNDNTFHISLWTSYLHPLHITEPCQTSTKGVYRYCL